MLFDNDSVNPMMGGFGLIGMVFYAIFMLVVIAVGVGLTIIVVRYLLITTKAAQVYIAKNSEVQVATPPAATAPPVATATAATAPPAATAPAARAKADARAPKTPPTS